LLSLRFEEFGLEAVFAGLTFLDIEGVTTSFVFKEGAVLLIFAEDGNVSIGLVFIYKT
jgi:hypothetical protein